MCGQMTYLLMECDWCCIMLQACVYLCSITWSKWCASCVVYILAVASRAAQICGALPVTSVMGALFFLVFLQEVFVWTLLQWLQHLCLVSWISLIVLVTIFENEKCLLLIVFKQGAVIVKWSWKVFGPAKAVSQWVIHGGLEKAVILWYLNGGIQFIVIIWCRGHLFAVFMLNGPEKAVIQWCSVMVLKRHNFYDFFDGGIQSFVNFLM